ncbi:MAG: NUDIX hydrolase [Candidatus Peribacteria bacterium]|jgi:8-oxo-dGTP pyrophosphatase MutT (NUDIX family)|nr:NUDIX hydrolase [Candidatus Peribacteria bacterium]
MEQQIPSCFYRISAKALILDKEKKFLLNKEDNGRWEFPGGGLDRGENPQEGIARELQEEMNIHAKKVSDTPAYFVTSKNLKDFRIANVLYETLIDEGELAHITPSEECVEIGFFTKEEAKKLDLYPNVEEFLKVFNPDNH